MLVEAVRIRNGPVVLRCRLDEAQGFPVLEIPQWMFDAHICGRVDVRKDSVASCQSLRDLTTLLVEAQQASWIPGGVDAQAVEAEERSAQSIPDIAADSGVVNRSESENRELAGTNAARARGDHSQFGEGARS